TRTMSADIAGRYCLSGQVRRCISASPAERARTCSCGHRDNAEEPTLADFPRRGPSVFLNSPANSFEFLVNLVPSAGRRRARSACVFEWVDLLDQRPGRSVDHRRAGDSIVLVVPILEADAQSSLTLVMRCGPDGEITAALSRPESELPDR